MYTDVDFRTKTALREAVAADQRVTVWQPGPFAKDPATYQGRVFIEGPQYPKAHSWYAQADVVNGVIVKGSVK